MRKLNFVLITMAFITFIIEPHFSSANQNINIPYIGKVRKIFDSGAKETKYFIPIAEDEFTKNRIANTQLLRLGKIKQYLTWLQTERDPDVRRHYLFEISNASGKEAKWVTNELIPMLGKEPEEDVRIAYISCFSSLAANAGLSDSEILNILNVISATIDKDSSWNVRIHATNILSWYGGDKGITAIKEVIDKNISVAPNILHCVPATLQRINNDAAKAILSEIKSHSKDDVLITDSVWRLYQLGLANMYEMLNITESIAKHSDDEKARARAIWSLTTMANDNPEVKSNIKNIIEGIRKDEKSRNVKKVLDEALEILERQ